MGLLATLDLHKQITSGAAPGVYPELEYKLVSWGEIYPPFIGDREHSINAQYIMRDFPFKLFSMSTPYSELPQRLCLTFRAPEEVKKHTDQFHLAGIFPDEIAKEFAAFLSLVTRRRVFPVGQMRYEGLPLEQKAEIYQQSHYQERQRLREIRPSEIYNLLKNLQVIDRHVAQGFVLAMRLYHSAVEMMYTEPEFSYLFLVTCLEAISSVVCREYKPTDEGAHPTELDKYLDSRYPGWHELIDISLLEHRSKLLKVLLCSERFVFRKLLKFVTENTPECFWNETEDDAKPDYINTMIGPGPDGLGEEYFSRSDIAIRPWEQINKAELESQLRDIYEARSKMIHEGIRLPESIIVGHFRLLPAEAATETTRPVIPPLITLERLVSYSMVGFLRKQRTE